MPGDAVIRAATSAADMVSAAALMRAYAEWLDIDLGFQGFEAELASLPGKYGPPSGSLLLARLAGGTAVGCVALRALPTPGTCEMKRLYVSPEGRGQGLGRRLAEAIVGDARRFGYSRMCLDTLPTMTSALAVYRGLGFVETAPYYETPVAGTVFLALDLGGRALTEGSLPGSSLR